MVGAEMGAAVERLVHRCQHGGMVMAEQQGAVAAEIVDILVAVDIPFARPLGALDIDAVGLDVAGIVGNAARQDVIGLGGETLGASGALAIGGDDLRVGGAVV